MAGIASGCLAGALIAVNDDHNDQALPIQPGPLYLILVVVSLRLAAPDMFKDSPLLYYRSLVE